MAHGANVNFVPECETNKNPHRGGLEPGHLANSGCGSPGEKEYEKKYIYII